MVDISIIGRSKKSKMTSVEKQEAKITELSEVQVSPNKSRDRATKNADSGRCSEPDEWIGFNGRFKHDE